MHRHCMFPCFLVTSQNVSVQGRGARNRNCYGRKMGRGGGRKLIAKKKKSASIVEKEWLLPRFKCETLPRVLLVWTLGPQIGGVLRGCSTFWTWDLDGGNGSLWEGERREAYRQALLLAWTLCSRLCSDLGNPRHMCITVTPTTLTLPPQTMSQYKSSLSQGVPVGHFVRVKGKVTDTAT